MKLALRTSAAAAGGLRHGRDPFGREWHRLPARSALRSAPGSWSCAPPRVFDPRSPEKSGLRMAPAPGPGRDGKAREGEHGWQRTVLNESSQHKSLDAERRGRDRRATRRAPSGFQDAQERERRNTSAGNRGQTPPDPAGSRRREDRPAPREERERRRQRPPPTAEPPRAALPLADHQPEHVSRRGAERPS